MTEGLNPFEPPKHDDPEPPRRARRRRREGAGYFLDASPRTRFVNYAVDVALMSMVVAALGLDDEARGLSTFGLCFGYWFGFELLFAKTPAKWLTRTRVATVGGSRPTFSHVLLRTLVRFVPFDQLSFLGRGRGWHDRWTKTRVIHDPDVVPERDRR